jgi:hypothetical protein
VKIFLDIQGVQGGKVSTLGGHSIGHSKQKCICMCPIPNGFQDSAILLYSSEIFHESEILRTVSYADT